jgi:membrane fusion protein (multidrug efflux system)
LILAPESGTVVDKKINQGEYVTPGTALGTLACLKEVLVNVFVQEDEAARLKNGMRVTVRADAYPGSIYTGKVSAVIPVASAAKTFPVEIRIVNDNSQKLLAGMNVSVVFGADKRSKALVIPRSALTSDKEQAAVYIIHQSRHPVLTPIVIGKEYDTYLGISRGLKVGDTVMTSGLLNVGPGKRIEFLTVQQ